MVILRCYSVISIFRGKFLSTFIAYDQPFFHVNITSNVLIHINCRIYYFPCTSQYHSLWFLCIIGRSIQNREKNLPPVPPPPPQRGKGEDAPFENCAKKRRVGRNSAHLFTPFCTEVTSLCTPLEKGGHTDGDGETLPAPVQVTSH